MFLGSSVLTKEAEGTAKAFLFFAKLLDNFNGSSSHAQEGHELRCVTNTSPHHNFWTEAKIFLQTMKFECCTTKQHSVPPSLKNWVWTIFLEILIVLIKISRNEARDFFFCCIQSHGARNINSTCSSFITSFKALTLNNFTAPTSVAFNCENDYRHFR